MPGVEGEGLVAPALPAPDIERLPGFAGRGVHAPSVLDGASEGTRGGCGREPPVGGSDPAGRARYAAAVLAGKGRGHTGWGALDQRLEAGRRWELPSGTSHLE